MQGIELFWLRKRAMRFISHTAEIKGPSLILCFFFIVKIRLKAYFGVE